MTVDPLDVLALLEEKAYTEAELLALFETSRQILTFTLKALKRDGRVIHVGSRWALRTIQAPPAPVRAPTPARTPPDVDEDDLEAALDDDAEDLEPALDEDEELLEAPEPTPGTRGQRLGADSARMYPTGQRQAKLPKDISSGPGWWVAHAAPGQRDQFQQAAAARNAEMREKSPAWRSQTTSNQPHK